jgi:hypothetical protein
LLKKEEEAIDIKPNGETRYFLSWVHKRTVPVHFTDIMLGFHFNETPTRAENALTDVEI